MPPGRVLNALNKFVQMPVAGQLIEGIHWTMICLYAGLLAPFVLLYKIGRAVQAAGKGADEPSASDRASLGIFISGCDSGFGQMAALKLHEKGYTVFAGCLTSDGQAMLREICKDDARMVTVSLDVRTNQAALAIVLLKEASPQNLRKLPFSYPPPGDQGRVGRRGSRRRRGVVHRRDGGGAARAACGGVQRGHRDR